MPFMRACAGVNAKASGALYAAYAGANNFSHTQKDFSWKRIF